MVETAFAPRRAAAAAALILVASAAAFGVGWAASGLIERGTTARATASARAAGLDWLRIEADGSTLTLRGTPPDAAAAEQALALADGFWRFAAVSVALEAPPQPAPARPAAASAAPRLSILIDAQGVSFGGALPDEASRARVAQALGALRGAPAKDMCALTEGAPPPLWPTTQRAALEAAPHLDHGAISATAGVVELRGGARDATARAALEALAARVAPQGVELRLDLDPSPAQIAAAARPDGAQAEVAGTTDSQAPTRRAAVAADGASWLRVQLTPDLATLTGAAPDAATRKAVLSYAAAAFGAARLHDGLSLAEGPAPAGWRAAALAGVDALAALDRGEAMVADGRITVTGAALDPLAARRAALALTGDAAPGWETESRVLIDLPARAAATRLPPGRCAERLTEIAALDPILFEPGSAAIEAASVAVLDRLAATLRRCGGGDIVVEGHTDSQGSEGYNAELSQARADAVRAALIERGAPEAFLTARGYGESRPIADNSDEDGRALNRRIAFAPRFETDPANADERTTESEAP